jgi:hypothetical protein
MLAPTLRLWLRLLSAIGLTTTGCASNLSTLQTAETTPKHHLEVHAGYGAFIPTNAAPHLVKALGMEEDPLKQLVSGHGYPPPTKAQQDELLDTALALALETPGTEWELGARFGLTDDWDIGGRYSSNDWALDTKYRLWHTLPNDRGISQHLAVDVRFVDVDISNPIIDALGYVGLDNFSRYDGEFGLLYTLNWKDILKVYGGPKYVFTYFEADETLYELTNVASDATGIPHLVGSVDSTMHFFGGVGGLSVGYWRIHGFLELNAGYTLLKPTILGEKRNLSGLTFFPAIGLAVSI